MGTISRSQLVVMMTLGVLASPAAAQTEPTKDAPATAVKAPDESSLDAIASSRGLACLSRRVQGRKLTTIAAARADADNVAIAVSAGQTKIYTARGFAAVKCDAAPIITQAQREQICAFAPAKDPAMNAFFWQRFGFTPSESCTVLKDVTASSK